ncbi:hypothetical protein D3C87_890230 [compost metagenome]
MLNAPEVSAITARFETLSQATRLSEKDVVTFTFGAVVNVNVVSKSPETPRFRAVAISRVPWT